MATTGAKVAQDKYIEPLSKDQQQRIMMQLGLDGYKNLIKINCYNTLVIRIRTERWNDQYCAESYRHLDFAEIKGQN